MGNVNQRQEGMLGKMVLNLDTIPERAQGKLSMALAWSQVKAGVDILFQLMHRYEFLNDQVPPEWANIFHMSLDEVSAECSVCVQKYRDAAITEVAQGIVDQLLKNGGKKNG